jgi:hypothetical protein
MSLLATAIYLSIPSVASQAFSAILSTIGPYTVLHYLDFALGKPIQFPSAVVHDPPAAAGLEHVAELFDDATSTSVQSTKGDDSEDSDTQSSCLTPDTHIVLPSSPVHHYGSLSDKIGEAVSCWLARWGVDFLSYEQGDSKLTEYISATRLRRMRTFPSSAKSQPEIDTSLKPSIPGIWSRGGLSPEWINVLISSDALFVKNERERYNFARAVVERRRHAGIIPDEEAVWTDMFDRSIYYANMVSRPHNLSSSLAYCCSSRVWTILYTSLKMSLLPPAGHSSHSQHSKLHTGALLS